jgi:small subunit ribosomal protein S3
MGQKVNPHGLRVGVIKDWDSRWYAKNEKVGDLLVEDYNIRKQLKKELYSAGIPKIEIERDSSRVRIYLHCSRPGVVIGKGGTEIERVRLGLEKKIGRPVSLSIVEVKNPDASAQLVSESIAAQLEKRVGFRRAMKNAMQRAMRLGVRGIKVAVSGRLGGAEIARTEHYHEGTIPLQTIRADIEYGFAEAATSYGRIGVKVWIYKGEILNQTLRSTPRAMDTTRAPGDRPNRNDRRRGGGQGGYRNNQGGGYRGQGQGQGQGGGYRGQGQGQGGGYRSQGQGQGGGYRGQGQGQGGGYRGQGQGQGGGYRSQGQDQGGQRPGGYQGGYRGTSSAKPMEGGAQ